MTALYVPPTGETDPKKQNQSLQLIGGVTSTNTTNIAANTASIAQHESAWVAYTPTITAFSGTFTTISATGRYKAIGKTVHVTVEIIVTTVGTGTFPLFTLPVTPLDINKVSFFGAETALTGKTIHGRGNSGVFGSTPAVSFYDNTNPAASGNKLELAGTYEAA